MFFIGKSHKVNQSIIISDTVKMMDNPSPGQFFPVGLLPKQYMFPNVAAICSRVFRVPHYNIATCCWMPTSLPITRPFSVKIISSVLHARFSVVGNKFTTNRARLTSSLFSQSTFKSPLFQVSSISSRLHMFWRAVFLGIITIRKYLLAIRAFSFHIVLL